MKPLLLFTSFIVVIAALTVSCSFAKDEEQGKRAVEKFHQQLNAGQYQEIYQQGDDKFKEAVTEADFTPILEAVRRKLGTVQKATFVGGNVNSGTMGTVATLQYEVEFSEGKGTEKFSFLVSGEEAKLLRYDVNSPAFIK
jgi:hypothetical protein